MEEKNYSEPSGSVTLVGAGCGPGLITIQGLEVLRRAQTVVYDDLIDRDLLAEAPVDCAKIYVGKRYGSHSKRQEEISRILIEEARKGHRVVRLKGGDSFVFGRGGEEYLALQEAGVPCSVVPGVSSAIAVPEHAGIPVTHRQMARSFTVVTGHTADGTGEDYRALAQLKGTLVFLMAVHHFPQITSELIRNGRSPETPAAVVSKGFSPDERRIDGTLENIADRAAAVPTPAVLVVGDTAAFSMISETGGPLDGVRVTVTGTRSFTHRVGRELTSLGAQVFLFPTIQIVPHAERIPADFSRYGWIVFTSSNGVRIFFDTMRTRKQDMRCLAGLKFAVIGKGTADELQEHGIYADLLPPEFTAQKLGEALVAQLRETQDRSRVLILRAQNGSELLTEALSEGTVAFDDVKIYETAPADNVPGSAKRVVPESGYLVFGSAGGVRAFFSMGYELRSIPVCIGRQTASELRKHIAAPFLTAKEYSSEGIGRIIAQHLDKSY